MLYFVWKTVYPNGSVTSTTSYDIEEIPNSRDAFDKLRGQLNKTHGPSAYFPSPPWQLDGVTRRYYVAYSALRKGQPVYEQAVVEGRFSVAMDIATFLMNLKLARNLDKGCTINLRTLYPIT